MKLCKNCKAELEDNQKFCHKCGSNEFEAQEDKVNIPQSGISALSKKGKKKAKKILIIIIAAIALIVLALGTVSLVNYNKNKPYEAIIAELENNDFCYYKEYDEISCIDFYEEADYRNFFEKALNIHKYHEIAVYQSIYYLYDEDDVENYEKLKDVISEAEEDEYCINGYADLLINGDDAFINCYDGTVITINVIDNEIISITCDRDEKEYININNDSKLKEKYELCINQYEDYLEREENAQNYLNDAKNAPLYYGNTNVGTIAEFIRKGVSNPNVTIEAHIVDKTVYCITVRGKCRIGSTYKDNASVSFNYHIDENASYVAKDSNNAFEWYYYSLIFNW